MKQPVKAGTALLFAALLATCSTAPATAENRLTAFALGGYRDRLSKSVSVTPERNSGIFTPAIRLDGGVTPLWRVDTAKYNTLTGNMPGGSNWPRVKPATRYPHYRLALSQNQLGVAHHG